MERSKKQIDPANANVQARLFKSGPVQEAMDKCLKDIRRVLGIEEVKEPKKKRLRAKDYPNGASGKDTNAYTQEDIAVPAPRAKSKEEEWSELSDPEDTHRTHRDHDNLDPGTASNIDDDEYDLYASRLAASSDSDSDSDSNSADRESPHKSHPPSHLNPSSITPSPAPSRSPSLSRSPSPPPKSPHKSPSTTAQAASKKPPPKPKSTTFLPSLSQSVYFSGSDSDSSPPSDAGAAPKRKNRRGQQARRAIWEQKFGGEARHVKLGLTKPAAGGKSRDQGWDVRKGAVGAGKGRWGEKSGRKEREMGRSDGRANGAGRGPSSSGANSEAVANRRPNRIGGRSEASKGKSAKSGEEGKLHPSWEAARKAKELKKAVPFQGKKVVF